MSYDPHGNLVEQKDYIYVDGGHANTHTIRFSYDQKNQVSLLIQGVGAPEEKKTFFAYTPSGKIASKYVLGDPALLYEYHPLGFLKAIKTSDDKLHHTFQYNLLGDLIKAKDD